MSKVRIWSGEHGMWWRPFGQGYTPVEADAGLFTAEYGASIARSVGPEKQIEVRPVPDPDELVHVEWVDSNGVARRWLALGCGSTDDWSLAHAWRRADAEERVRGCENTYKLIPIRAAIDPKPKPEPTDLVNIRADSSGRWWLAKGLGTTLERKDAATYRRADAEIYAAEDHFPCSIHTAVQSDLVSPWVPTSNPVDLKHLGKLGEELGEASAAVSRCVIQGIDEREPVTGKLNREWLEDELADVKATMDLAVERFGLDRDRMTARADRKRAALRVWHAL